MEIGDQCFYNLKFVSRIDENSGAVVASLNPEALRRLHRRTLQSSGGGGAHGDDPLSRVDGVVDDLRILLRHRILLEMHVVLLDVLAFYRTEGADAHVQSDIGDFHAFLFDFLQQLFGKMKSGCRGGYRSVNTAVYRLIGFFVCVIRRPLDVRRKRHAPQLFQPLHENAFVLKTNLPGSLIRILKSQNMCLEQVLGIEHHRVPFLQSLSRADHGFPYVPFQPLNQQEFDVSARHRLPSEQPSGNDP